MLPDMREVSSTVADEHFNVRRVSDTIISLVSSSHSIRCFSGKWQLIRDKLEVLLSGLTTAHGVEFSGEDSEFSAYLNSVNSTLNDVGVLLERCGYESYNGGKLLISSDLGAMASRLELHNKQLSEIHGSGDVTDSQAIVLPKPGVGAGEDERRLYVKDAFSRLKIGNDAVKSQAMDALEEILREDESYGRIIADENSGAIAMLVSFLEWGDAGIREKAAGVVSVIAEFECLRGALVTAGVVVALIQLLEKAGETTKLKAAKALRKLTENCDNVWSVSAQGGVGILLEICDNGNCNAELIALASGILWNLSSVEEIKGFMIDEGVVSVLIKLSGWNDEACRTQAIEFLHALSSKDDVIKQNVIREGVIQSLVEVLNPSSGYSSKARETALRATEFFCFSSPILLNVLMSHGFLNHLLSFLRNGEVSIQELTLGIVSHLCQISEEYKKAIGDAGFLPEVLRLLEAKSFESREMSAEVLRRMITVQLTRRSLIHDGCGVERIMQLLNPEEGKLGLKRRLLSVLSLVADSNSGRKKMLESDHLQYLEKLAAADVLEAKKVMKKLSGNRFRSILSGIWSY